MTYQYWSGEKVQLRVVEVQDIVFVENLDDEVNRNVDILQFEICYGMTKEEFKSRYGELN